MHVSRCQNSRAHQWLPIPGGSREASSFSFYRISHSLSRCWESIHVIFIFNVNSRLFGTIWGAPSHLLAIGAVELLLTSSITRYRLMPLIYLILFVEWDSGQNARELSQNASVRDPIPGAWGIWNSSGAQCSTCCECPSRRSDQIDHT